MRKAVGVLKELSADEATRMRYEDREMARRDSESLKAEAIRKNDEKWQVVVADKDAAIADKDAAIADKDAAIADRDAAIAKQAAIIAELQERLSKG